MKLEQRVESLEHELNILKNEIQVTLLEIQEQILNHYYPELRAEHETAPTSGRNGSKGATGSNTGSNGQAAGGGKTATGKTGSGKDAAMNQAKPEALAAINHRGPRKTKASPFSDMELADLGDSQAEDELMDEDVWDSAGWDEDAEDEVEFDDPLVDLYGEVDDEDDDDEDEDGVQGLNKPQVREVTSLQVRRTAGKLRGAASNGKAQTATKQAATKQAATKQHTASIAPVANKRVFASLATWVGESVSTIGKSRTLEVIETYAAGGGRLTKESKSALEQLVDFTDDNELLEAVSNKAAMEVLIRLDEILSDE